MRLVASYVSDQSLDAPIRAAGSSTHLGVVNIRCFHLDHGS